MSTPSSSGVWDNVNAEDASSVNARSTSIVHLDEVKKAAESFAKSPFLSNQESKTVDLTKLESPLFTIQNAMRAEKAANSKGSNAKVDKKRKLNDDPLALKSEDSTGRMDISNDGEEVKRSEYMAATEEELSFQNTGVFRSWDSNLKTMPGFSAQKKINLSMVLSKMTNQPMTQDFSLGTPIAINNDVYVVGTDRADAKYHYIMCVVRDSTNLSGMKLNSYAKMPHHVRDLKLMAATSEKYHKVLVTFGDGEFGIISIERQTNIISKTKRSGLAELSMLPRMHYAAIREIALSPFDRSKVLSGGFDKTVVFFDLEHNSAIFTNQVKKVISSVQWPSHTGGIAPSVTTDSGLFLTYDLRQNPVEGPAGKMQFSKREGLYTHCRLSEHSCLFGFADGLMRHMDIRKLTSSKHYLDLVDPFVTGIGHFAMSNDNTAFVSSGYSDFSTYSIRDGSVAKLWSHSETSSDIDTQPQSESFGSIFLPDNKTVLSGSSTGCLSFHEQNFSVVKEF